MKYYYLDSNFVPKDVIDAPLSFAFDDNQTTQTVFDKFKENDIVLAFFPCIRFEAQILLNFRGENSGFKNWSLEKKLNYDLKLHEELNENYSLITKMVLICLRKNIKLMIENPYTEQHYLTRYWCLKPTIIDKDRRKNGDNFMKPTQYFFINFEPYNNFIFEPLFLVENKNVNDCSTVERSMINSQYANRFIRTYLIEEVVK